MTEYGEDDTPWEDEYIPMDKYIQWRSKTWSNNNELYGEYKEQEALWLKEKEAALDNARSTLSVAEIAEATAVAVVCDGTNTQPPQPKKKKTRKSKVHSSSLCL